MATAPLHTVLGYLRATSARRADPGDAVALERFIAHREEAAFAAILRQHGPMVLAVCRRILHGDHDAEDAFQATFLVLARKAGSIGKRQALASWLHGVALRTALKRRNQLARRRKYERQAVPMDRVEPEPEVVWTDLRRVLDEEVNRLPEKYRAAVVLCYLEGRTYDAAAQRLGCSRGTLSTRLTHARGLLRRALAGRGLALSAGLLAVVLTEHAAPAAVPPLLAAQSLRAALLFADGRGAASAASAPVLTLTQGVLQAMSHGKLTSTLLMVLGVCLLGGLAVGIHQAPGATPPPAPAARQQAGGPASQPPQPAVQSQPPKQKVTRAAALEEALKAAAKVKDGGARAAVLADIAAAQVRMGDKTAGGRTFELALETANKLKGDPAALALARIARAQAEAGNLQTAARQNFERAWKEAADSERWTEIHPDIGILQLQAGFTDEGWKKLEETFERIGGVLYNNLQAHIVSFQLRAGDLAGGAATLERMIDNSPSLGDAEADALVEFAEAVLANPKADRKVLAPLVKKTLGQLAKLADVGKVPAPQFIVLHKPYGLASVAIVEARLGNKQEALGHLRQARTILSSEDIPNADWPLSMKVNGLAKVAEAEAALGDADGARKTLKDARGLVNDKTGFGEWAILSVAEAQMRMGDWSAALMTVEPLGKLQSAFLQQLARAQAAAGQSETVMDWAAEEDVPLLRARAYLGVAWGLEGKD
jgi:RNA polymerase sigma factor (sigma-70 family)